MRNANGCLSTMVNNPFKENFYWKRKRKKKKKKDILTIFSISHKTCVKTFLKYIVNYLPKDTH